jgi:hypothetical protein
MSSSIELTIYEKIKGLPQEKQREVLEFVEKIESQTVKTKPSIWAEIREIVKDVPEEAWREIPADGSAQHDHYLYGAPKK